MTKASQSKQTQLLSMGTVARHLTSLCLNILICDVVAMKPTSKGQGKEEPGFPQSSGEDLPTGARTGFVVS